MLKSKRAFLEPGRESDSYYSLTVNVDPADAEWDGSTDLKLTDCSRTINWHFGVPGDKRAIRKITVVKKLVDSIYEHLTGGQ